MKRDMDLIRDLLLKIEAGNKISWKVLVPQGTSEPEAQRILEHLKLVEDEGLVKSIPMHVQGNRVPFDLELTWQGHEWLKKKD